MALIRRKNVSKDYFLGSGEKVPALKEVTPDIDNRQQAALLFPKVPPANSARRDLCRSVGRHQLRIRRYDLEPMVAGRDRLPRAQFRIHGLPVGAPGPDNLKRDQQSRGHEREVTRPARTRHRTMPRPSCRSDVRKRKTAGVRASETQRYSRLR